MLHLQGLNLRKPKCLVLFLLAFLHSLAKHTHSLYFIDVGLVLHIMIGCLAVQWHAEVVPCAPLDTVPQRNQTQIQRDPH